MPVHIAEGVATSASLIIANPTSSQGAVNMQTLTRAGFMNRTDSTLSYDSSSMTVTVSGTSFDVWANNTLYRITGSVSATHGTTGGTHFVYFNSSGQMTSSITPWDPSSDQIAPVAAIYYDGIASGVMGEERHGALRNRNTHAYLHNTRGTAYDNGLTVTFTSASLSATSGRMWDEDISLDLSGSTTARLWYRSGSLSKFTTGSTVPYMLSGTTPQVDISGVLTNVTNGNYFNSWLFATNEVDAAGPLTLVLGQGQYTSLTTAQAGPQPTIQGLSAREWKLIYRAVYRFQGGNVTLQATDDYRTVSNLPGAAAPTTLPASQVTYVSTSPFTAGNVQSAVDEVKNITTYGGLFYDGPPAASGGAGDPTGSLGSGVWQALSWSLSDGLLSANGICSASVGDGRLYVSSDGVYFVHADVSIETNTNPNVHLGIFVTGTEAPRYTVAADFGNNTTHDMSISGLITLASGNYVDLRVRANSAVSTFTMHHYIMEIFRISL